MITEHAEDRYRVVEEIGRGGMGVVFRAHDQLLQRDVAIKTLAPDVADQRDAVRRLLQEARAVAKLDHPNIVRLYDAFEDPGSKRLHLVMELVEGQSIADALLDGPIPQDVVVRLVGEVAASLQTAHEAGLIHRDVKPSNILLRADGTAVLADFGLAKALEMVSRAGATSPYDVTKGAPPRRDESAVGTPAYAAPEQALGHRSSPATDQFQLAVSAFEMLTRELPWSPTNLLARLGQQPTGGLLDDHGIRAEVLPVLARAMSERQEDRYPSILDFSDAFRAAATGAATSGRVPKPTRGRPALSRLRATAIGLGIGLIGVMGWVAAQRAIDPTGTTAGPATAASNLAPLPPPGLVCPPFEVTGAGHPAAGPWLGAAAATLACQRLAVSLGLGASDTLTPPGMLGLPRAPRDDFPAADYASIQPPEETGGTVATGAVRLLGPGRIEAELTLIRDGSETTARGRGGALWLAVSEAADGALPPEGRAASDPIDYAPWLVDTEALLRHQAARWAVETGIQAGERCRAMARDYPEVMGELGQSCRAWAPDLVIRPGIRADPPETEVARDVQAGLHGANLDEEERTRLRRRLAAHRETGDLSENDLISVLAAEATTLALDGDPVGAASTILAAVELRPELTKPWEVLVMSSRGAANEASVHQAYAAWHPESAGAWCARRKTTTGPERSLALGRCHFLAPAVPVNAMFYGADLVDAGRLADAEGVAASLRVLTPRGSLASAFIRGRVMARRGLLLGAWRDLDRAWTDETTLGGDFFHHGDGKAITWLLELAELLGKLEETATRLAERFVLSEPTRVETFSYNWVPQAYGVCLAVVDSATGRRCVDVVEEARRHARLAPAGPDVDYADAIAALTVGDDERAGASLRAAITAAPGRFFVPYRVLGRLPATLADLVDGQYRHRTDFAGTHPAGIRSPGPGVPDAERSRRRRELLDTTDAAVDTTLLENEDDR